MPLVSEFLTTFALCKRTADKQTTHVEIARLTLYRSTLEAA